MIFSVDVLAQGAVISQPIHSNCSNYTATNIQLSTDLHKNWQAEHRKGRLQHLVDPLIHPSWNHRVEKCPRLLICSLENHSEVRISLIISQTLTDPQSSAEAFARARTKSINWSWMSVLASSHPHLPHRSTPKRPKTPTQKGSFPTCVFGSNHRSPERDIGDQHYWWMDHCLEALLHKFDPLRREPPRTAWK